MSEIEDQEQNGGIPDYIMNLEDVPSKLPSHLELLKTRVICNMDAPQHVSMFPFIIIPLSFLPLNLTLFFIIIGYFGSIKDRI